MVMSMCKAVSCVVGRGCLLWPVSSLGKTLVSFCCASFCSPRPRLACYSRYLLTSSFCIPVSCNEKDIFFGSFLHRTVQLQLLQHFWLWHRLGSLWYWFALEMNRNHCGVFEIASKYCISVSLVDYDGYSISSKGSLPTVVDIMVIWVKFTYYSIFQFADS